MPSKIESLLCQHSFHDVVMKQDRAVCAQCGSFWDLRAVSNAFTYTDAYASDRLHEEEAIGHMKVETLKQWLKQSQIFLESKVVCEVGFGAGFTLQYIFEHAREVWGTEVIEANFQKAIQLGVPATNLIRATQRPARLPNPVDLWLFQDSFEHLPDPTDFMEWLRANAAPQCQILLVAPRADAWSSRLLGSLGPHRLPDHAFHWSLRGLAAFMGRYGFRLERTFFPWKHVSLSMVEAHLRHKFGIRSTRQPGTSLWSRVRVPFNMGEMGLVFVFNENAAI